MITAPEPSGLDVAIGLLTIPQAAAKMAFLFPKASDSTLLVQRLIARGSLSAVTFAGGSAQIEVDALAAFMRDGASNKEIRAGMGLPPETPAPIFPMGNTSFGNPWNYLTERLASAAFDALGRQIPQNAANMQIVDRVPAQTPINPSHTIPITPSVKMSAELTPDLLGAMRAPVPTGQTVLPLPDGSMFTGLLELFLATLLQAQAEREIDRRSYADPQNIQLADLARLYASPADYASIVNAAIAAFESRSFFTLTRLVSRNDATAAKMLEPVSFQLSLPNTALVKLANSSTARLGCLAF